MTETLHNLLAVVGPRETLQEVTLRKEGSSMRKGKGKEAKSEEGFSDKPQT